MMKVVSITCCSIVNFCLVRRLHLHQGADRRQLTNRHQADWRRGGDRGRRVPSWDRSGYHAGIHAAQLDVDEYPNEHDVLSKCPPMAISS